MITFKPLLGMRKLLISCCCYILAIAMVVVLFSICKIRLGDGVYGFFLLISSGCILYDNKRTRAWRYYASLPMFPAVWLFLFVLLLWPIVFPYYLGLRFRIMVGTARLREEFKPWNMDDAQIGPNGLLQPWRGRRI